MHKVSRPVINPYWVMLGGVEKGNKEDLKAKEGGRHTP